MKRKNWIGFLLCAALLVSVMAGCAMEPDSESPGVEPSAESPAAGGSGFEGSIAVEPDLESPAAGEVFAAPAPVGAAFALDHSHYVAKRPESFTNAADYAAAWRYMLVNTDFEEDFETTLSCTRDELDTLTRTIEDAYYPAMADYMEFASFLNQWQVSVRYLVDDAGNCIDPSFTLTLSNGSGLTNEEVTTRLAAFKASCEEAVSTLYQSGALRSGMTAKEKALVLLRYTAHGTQYGPGYTGYDAAVLGVARCQGYTAMYNYLCNLAGVRMEAATGIANGIKHAWSRVRLGGVWYNVDTTWADPVPDRAGYCDERWFWLTDEALLASSGARSFDSYLVA
jgi:hypothetical protein